MAMITPQEILDLFVMTFAIAFIFKDSFPYGSRQHKAYDPLEHYLNPKNDFIESMKFGALAAAPAVVLHELMHKILGLAFGLKAVFHAAYTWLLIGVFLKVVNFPVIFFVPGYVSISGSSTYFAMALVAVAGPLTNLTLWFLSSVALKKEWMKKHSNVLYISKQINMFLFFFNMLPIPGLDGFSFYSNIYYMFF